MFGQANVSASPILLLFNGSTKNGIPINQHRQTRVIGNLLKAILALSAYSAIDGSRILQYSSINIRTKSIMLPLYSHPICWKFQKLVLCYIKDRTVCQKFWIVGLGLRFNA